MAEAHFSEYQNESRMDQSGQGGVTILHWVGALVSIGLISGLGVWGYKLAKRDITGIPVVRALDGPMRIQPDDPGGEQARHQGLAINRVQAEGEALPTAERLILAPPPISLIAADQPVSDDRPAPREVALAEPALEGEPVLASLVEDSVELPNARAEAIDAEPAPVASAALENAVEQAVETAQAAEEARELIPQSVPGVALSPRPLARPELDIASYQRVAALGETGTAASEPDAPGPVVSGVDPESIPPGTRLVQLGAFDSAEIAATEWRRLNDQFADYFAGKTQVIQKASRGGREFYRLRVMGFADLSDARRFCSVLLARDSACIPVSIR